MDYRRLGRTGLQVSELALGTVELGIDYGIRVPGQSHGRPEQSEAVRLVHAALEAGINFIDTARGYGRSETVLGQALADRRDQVVLATKVRTKNAEGETPAAEPLRAQMLASLDRSLAELRTDWVDIWQIHNFDSSLLDRVEPLAKVFDEVRRQGKVRWIGASTYGTEMPLAAVGSDLFDVVQVTYSVFDQRLAEEVFPAARKADIGIVARSVLLKGALTERADYLPNHLEPLRRRSRQYRNLVAQAAPEGQPALSPAQAAIAFALANQQIDAVLLGIHSLQELEEDLVAVAAHLSADLLRQLREMKLDDSELLNPGTWNIS